MAKSINREITKPIEKMVRQEIIQQLARHVHQDQYKEVIMQDTESLRKLLSWYTE